MHNWAGWDAKVVAIWSNAMDLSTWHTHYLQSLSDLPGQGLTDWIHILLCHCVLRAIVKINLQNGNHNAVRCENANCLWHTVVKHHTTVNILKISQSKLWIEFSIFCVASKEYDICASTVLHSLAELLWTGPHRLLKATNSTDKLFVTYSSSLLANVNWDSLSIVGQSRSQWHGQSRFRACSISLEQNSSNGAPLHTVDTSKTHQALQVNVAGTYLVSFSLSHNWTLLVNKCIMLLARCCKGHRLGFVQSENLLTNIKPRKQRLRNSHSGFTFDAHFMNMTIVLRALQNEGWARTYCRSGSFHW